MSAVRRGHWYYFAEARIAKIAESAPPMSDAQLDRLSALLLGAKSEDGGGGS